MQNCITSAAQRISGGCDDDVMKALKENYPAAFFHLRSLERKMNLNHNDWKGFRSSVNEWEHEWFKAIKTAKGELESWKPTILNRPERSREAAQMIAEMNPRQTFDFMKAHIPHWRSEYGHVFAELKRHRRTIHEKNINQAIFLCRCDAWRVAWRELIKLIAKKGAAR